MDSISLGYDRLIERFVTWARDQADIRGAIVIGSRARTERPADQWSDLDVVLFVRDPQVYLSNPDWAGNFGAFRITFLEPTATGGGMERRFLFDGGLDVDFAVFPVSLAEQWIRVGFPREIAEVLRKGMRVLLDPAGMMAQFCLPEAAPASSRLPAPREFDQVTNDFWYHAVWTAKKLKRGELWTAKSCCDGYMKGLLLRAIEWHAYALPGDPAAIWHNGRFLEEWADPRVPPRLKEAFAHYDPEEVARALRATMGLFRDLCEEIAARLHLNYPKAADELATQWVDTLLPTNPSPVPSERESQSVPGMT